MYIVQTVFFEFDTFLYSIKNTSYFIFLGFKVPSESFFYKNFKRKEVILFDISG